MVPSSLTQEFLFADAAVRRLHARYVDAVFRKDITAFGTCFASDAEWRVGGRIMHGRAEICSFMSAVFPQFDRILMTFRNPLVHLDEGAISARTYVSENSRFADGRPFGPIGIYYEHFASEDGQLLFHWRLFQTQYSGGPAMSGTFFDMPDYGAPPAMPPRDEPTYDRSGVSRVAASEL